MNAYCNQIFILIARIHTLTHTRGYYIAPFTLLIKIVFPFLLFFLHLMLEIVRKTRKIHTLTSAHFQAGRRVCVSLAKTDKLPILSTHTQILMHISLFLSLPASLTRSAKFKSISSLISYQFLHVVLCWPVQLPLALSLFPFSACSA